MDLLIDLVKQGLITDRESPKGKLLSTAANLFLEKGYQATTVRDLARALGIQSGSLFHHFKSKEEILKTVMEESIHVTLARQDIAVRLGKTPREKLQGMIRSELEVIHGPTKNGMTLLVSEWSCLSEKHRNDLLDLRKRYEDSWLEIIASVQKDELLAFDDVFVMRRLISGALGWTVYWFRPEGSLSLDQLTQYCLKMILKNPVTLG